MMDKTDNTTPLAPVARARLRCTAENAAEMRDLVRSWPEMSALVASLQDQGVFPGLRGLTVEITGPEAANGLQGAKNIILATNPPPASQNPVEAKKCN